MLIMHIKVEYQATLKELSRASLLFAEKKLFMRYAVLLLNILVGGFALIFLLYLLLIGFAVNILLAGLVCLIWLIGRRPFYGWLLYQNIKRSPVIEKIITIELSLNGIVWSGKGLKVGNLPWMSLKYALEAQNGFVLPNNFTTFLWLPFRGFASPEAIEDFRALLAEKKISLLPYKKWRC